MASICKINGKWRALIRRGGKSTSKWFDTKGKAQAWADEVEGRIEAGKAPVELTVSQAIQSYRKLRDKNRPISDASTEHYTLKMLERMLGDKSVERLTVDDIVAFCESRRDEGAGPYTINCDVSKLATVGRYVAPTLLPLLASARPKLMYLKLVGGGGRRERRPTDEELRLILSWLEEQKGRRYRDFVAFATLTAMRRGEVASLQWRDLNRDKKMILVRDRKDPRQKQGNDQWVPLLFGSYELVLTQPQDDERIFPIHPQTISKYFTECCKVLSIPDLHLHDLRHEGISQMFERGFDIPQVSIVSGHKSWQHLKRYTQIKPESLHLHDTRPSTEPRPDNQTTASHHRDTTAP